MAIPASINLTTADADGDQAAAGWTALESGLYEVVLGGTFGSATVVLQTYDTANSAWVSTGDSWTATGVSKLEFAAGPARRFYLSVTGSGADIDITIYPIRKYAH